MKSNSMKSFALLIVTVFMLTNFVVSFADNAQNPTYEYPVPPAGYLNVIFDNATWSVIAKTTGAIGRNPVNNGLWVIDSDTVYPSYNQPMHVELKPVNFDTVASTLTVTPTSTSTPTPTIPVTLTPIPKEVKYGEELENIPERQITINFSDVQDSHWAYKFIADMMDKKILSGYPDGLFRPSRVVTRAEFAKIIVSAAGVDVPRITHMSFTDVKENDWFNPFVEAAKDYLTGYKLPNGDLSFKPNSPALREDIAIAIVKLKGYDTALADGSIIEAMFSDYDTISDVARNYVALAVEHKLISGYPDGTFRPQNSLTRAETATLLWKAFLQGNPNKQLLSSKDTSSEKVIPTSVVTPSPEPTATPVPTTPTMPPKKYKVETLFGGNGAGSDNGSSSYASIFNALDSVIDDDGNIYFLDSNNLKYSIRKYDSIKKEVSTLALIGENFNYGGKTFSNGKFEYPYQYEYYRPAKLAFNKTNKKLYLAGTYYTPINIDSTDAHPTLNCFYEIAPTFNVAVKFSVNELDRITPDDFFYITETNSFVFSTTTYRPNYDRNIYKVSGTSTPLLLGTPINRHTDLKLQSLFGDDGISTLIIGERETNLVKISYTENKNSTTNTFSNTHFDGCTPKGSKFYASVVSDIFTIGADGNIAPYISSKEIDITDRLPLKTLTTLLFDTEGNIIFYDDSNKAFRRISLNKP